MSHLSVLINELLDDYRFGDYRIGDLYDQNFGLGITDDAILHPVHQTLLTPLRSGYIRPWRNLPASDSGLSSIQNDKNEFKITLDVQQFKPEEIKVKTENDYVVINGQHEERSDEHGFISRQFTRKYKLPKDVDVNALKSTISSDGVLSLNAPKMVLDVENARDIPIMKTNAPAIKNKEKAAT